MRLGDREVVPLVEIEVRAPARARGGPALALAYRRAMPVAVIERRGGKERRVVIPDATGQAVRGIVAVGAIVWIVLWIVRRRWSNDR